MQLRDLGPLCLKEHQQRAGLTPQSPEAAAPHLARGAGRGATHLQGIQVGGHCAPWLVSLSGLRPPSRDDLSVAPVPRVTSRSPGAAPSPSPVIHTARPMAAARAGLEALCARACGVNAVGSVHGERLRRLSSGPRQGRRRTARMSASLVRATVRAVSKRKLQPTRAALTLVSGWGARPGP